MPLPRQLALALAAASAVVALVAGEGMARASGANPVARLEFRVDGGLSGCKDAAAFRARVATRLGYDPFVEGAPLLVRVRFLARGPRVVSRIDIEDAGQAAGTRELEEATARCDALAEATAAAVAMAIDPVGRTAVAAVAASPTPTPEAPSVPEPPAAAFVAAERAPTPPPPPPAPSPATRLALTLDAVGAVGLAPGPTVGAQGGVGAVRGSVAGGVEGRIDASPVASRVAQADRVTSTAYSAALVGCGLVTPVSLCLGARLGSLETRGLDVSSSTTRGSLIALAFARVVGRLPLTQRLALRLGAEVALPFVRTTLSIDGRPTWTAPPLQGALVAGLDLTLP